MLFSIVTILGCLAIVLYSTWLFIHRLRSGASPKRSFWAWLKHLYEALWGL